MIIPSFGFGTSKKHKQKTDKKKQSCNHHPIVGGIIQGELTCGLSHAIDGVTLGTDQGVVDEAGKAGQGQGAQDETIVDHLAAFVGDVCLYIPMNTSWYINIYMYIIYIYI